MKKILFAFVALMALTFTACNKDILNTNPTDRVSGDTIFADTDGGMMALNGTIRALWEWGWATTGNYHQVIGPEGYGLMADLMGEDHVQAAQGSGWFWFDYRYNVKSRFTSGSCVPTTCGTTTSP